MLSGEKDPLQEKFHQRGYQGKRILLLCADQKITNQAKITYLTQLDSNCAQFGSFGSTLVLGQTELNCTQQKGLTVLNWAVTVLASYGIKLASFGLN